MIRRGLLAMLLVLQRGMMRGIRDRAEERIRGT